MMESVGGGHRAQERTTMGTPGTGKNDDVEDAGHGEGGVWKHAWIRNVRA